jgi:hypothetical protein
MELRHRTLGVLAKMAVFAAFAWAGTLRADLAPASPFLPAGAAAAAAAKGGPSGPIELRGVMASSDGASYCIYDTAKKKNFWVGLNESGHDFVVKSADPDGESVMVDYQGRSMHLEFHTSKVESSGPATAVTAGPRGGPASNPLSTSVVVNPTPADEQRRLDAVAQEVRRRRMERQKALEAQNGQVPGATPPGAPGR